MTETKPKTRPETKPNRETQKPKPRRQNDPWTIPAPKVNPTPKADKKEDMKTIKVILKTRADYNLFMNIMDTEEFFNKFEVDMNLVSKMAARDAMKRLEGMDSMLLKKQRIALVRGKF